jgi:energy-coupling factor transporter ATP-binding protein EcfA2
MKYLAIPQKTVEWLHGRPDVAAALADGLQSSDLASLAGGDFAEGPLRMVRDGDVIAIWNIDYQTSYGESAIGFLRLAGPHGTFSCPQPTQSSTFIRELYVLNQRLLNRLFMAADFYLIMSDGAKVGAPTAKDGTRLGFGLAEDNVRVSETATVKVVVVTGPEHDFDAIAKVATDDLRVLRPEVGNALRLFRGRKGTRVLPNQRFAALRSAINPDLVDDAPPEQLIAATQELRTSFSQEEIYRTDHLIYDEWIAPDSPLSHEQRAVINREMVQGRPVRIIGPAGSGKTLLMQLLAIGVMRDRTAGRQSVFYVTHNDAMRDIVWQRFAALAPNDDFNEQGQLQVATLTQFARDQLSLSQSRVFSTDAEKAKDEQLSTIRDALDSAIKSYPELVAGSPTLTALTASGDARDEFLELLRADISIAIKARDLMADKQAYTTASEPLGPLHAVMNPEEREFVYSVYTNYQTIIDVFEILDADDVALTMLGTLRTQKWRIDRRSRGFDYVFVDEAQLFNENERRVFAHLTKRTMPYIPVILALDEAQQVHLQKTSGLGLLGLEGLERTRLTVPHRLPRSVARLAYYVISQSSDLFNEDFPNFTTELLSGYSDEDAGAQPFLLRAATAEDIGRTVLKQISASRREGASRVLVVCHADAYWSLLEEEIKAKADRDFAVITDRGVQPAKPVVLARPEVIGGQEFDSVITVGMEEGVMPPRAGNESLQDLLEQAAIREAYLAFTRTRSRLAIVIGPHARPANVVQRAIEAGFIVDVGTRAQADPPG